MSRDPLRLLVICGTTFLLSLPSLVAQSTDKALEAPGHSTHSADSNIKDTPSPLKNAAYPQRTVKEVPREILRDQKFLWLRPFRIKRDDLPWAGVIVGTTAGLLALDSRVGQGLSDSPPGAGYTFSRRVGQLGTPLTGVGVAGAYYLFGRARSDERARVTGLLGLQAIADSVLVVEVLKNATQRPRPTFSGGRVRNHNADGEFFAGGRSFPSGHAAGAWALATVISKQYDHRPWIPPTAYGLASLVSVARITQRRHFPSDVFVGAVFGYLIGRHVSRGGDGNSVPRRRTLQIRPCTPSFGGGALSISWEF